MKKLSRFAAVSMLVAAPITLAACGGGDDKPAKADVKSGYSKLLKTSLGADASAGGDMLDKISSCTVDKIYDKATTQTLKAMASGDKSTKADDKDETLLTDATKECTTSAMKG